MPGFGWYKKRCLARSTVFCRSGEVTSIPSNIFNNFLVVSGFSPQYFIVAREQPLYIFELRLKYRGAIVLVQASNSKELIVALLRNTEIKIRTATSNDIKPAIDLLKANFINDPILAWMIDDPVGRLKAFDDFFHMYVTAGFNSGVVHVAEIPQIGMAGVIVWLTHDANTDKENKNLADTYTPRFIEYSDLMHERYPNAAPYYQLATTAIVPAARSIGVGSTLISHYLQELDKMGIPSYLEATTPRSAGGIYARLGYQPVGEPIVFPGGGKAYPMWRNAQQPDIVSLPHELDNSEASKLIGTLMHFGDYYWRVLDVQNNKALLISDRTIEKQMYHEKYEAVTWASCSLRQYLNGEFYNTFDKSEQAQIAETLLPNSNNPWFRTSGGQDTIDKIFLLSIEEAVKYLGDSKQLRSKNPNTPYYIDDHFNSARQAMYLVDSVPQWWLRTPGNTSSFASSITANGRISVSGIFVTSCNEAIRPAMWINM